MSPTDPHDPRPDSPQAMPPTGFGPPDPTPGQPYVPAPNYGTQPVPGQQYGATPQPAQPYSMPPQPAQPYNAPNQPYGAPVQGGMPGQSYRATGYPPQAPPKRGKLWLLIVIGVLVLALIGFLVYRFAIRDKDVPATPPATGGPAATPELVVQGYLEALAAGDATTALAFSSSKPADTTFLTDEVLATSLSLGPITDIQVTPDPPGNLAKATYNIGEQQVSELYHVPQFGDGFLMDSAAMRVDLSPVYQSGIGMQMNGVSLDGLQLTTVYLFPGTYQFTTTNPLLVVVPDQLVVETPDAYTPVHNKLTLATDAQAPLRAAAQATLEACLAEKVLVTSCGFGKESLEGGATPDLDTVTWTVIEGSSDFSLVDFVYYGYSSPIVARGSNALSVKIVVKDTAGNSYSGTESIFQAVADFTDPDNIKVTFR